MSHALLYVFLILTLACKSDKPADKRIDYELGKPDEVFVLGASLREISGLTMSGHYLAAVQDESGKLYYINPQDGSVVEKAGFWKDGDFEGVETVGSRLYALKSNGNIYRVDAVKPDDGDTEKYDLGFSSDDNFEGLGYEPATGNLLMASKRTPQARTKEIYAISPEDVSREAQAKQVYVVDQVELREYLMKREKRWIDRFARNLATANYSFNPSAIAVQPGSGDIYILSSPNPQLLVLNKNWKIKALLFLDPLKFRQPEAICFNDDEALFIANEGKDGKANILKFDKK